MRLGRTLIVVRLDRKLDPGIRGGLLRLGRTLIVVRLDRKLDPGIRGGLLRLGRTLIVVRLDWFQVKQVLDAFKLDAAPLVAFGVRELGFL